MHFQTSAPGLIAAGGRSDEAKEPRADAGSTPRAI